MADVRAVRADRGRIDGDSCAGAEFCCAADCWAASTVECRGDYDFAAFLGLGVGRHGLAAGDSDNRSFTGDLRSHGIVEACGALAERLKQRLVIRGVSSFLGCALFCRCNLLSATLLLR